jgi:molybdopterin synthase catalytic subunit
MRLPGQPRITSRPIDVDKVLGSVKDEGAGGTVMFLGTIRRRSEGRTVEGLEYEVYREMAERKMKEIEARIRSRWPVRKLAMVHRYGRLKVGDVSVAVAVSSEHRAEAFEACRYGIDTIKKSLPLWKKEVLRGGAGSWVKGTPFEE